jgi:hypothetical protein
MRRWKQNERATVPLTTRDLEAGQPPDGHSVLIGSQRDDNPILPVAQGAPKKAPERGGGDNAAAEPTGWQE